MSRSNSTLTMNVPRCRRSRQRAVRVAEDGVGMMVVQEYGAQTACCNTGQAKGIRHRAKKSVSRYSRIGYNRPDFGHYLGQIGTDD